MYGQNILQYKSYKKNENLLFKMLLVIKKT